MRFTFDASTIDPNQMPEPLPLNWYHVTITREEIKETSGSAGKGQSLTFFLKVLSGPHAGREQRDQLNIDNPNPTTVRIAQQRLSAYAHVTGQVRFNDTAELFNKPFAAKIGPQEDNPKYGEVFGLKDMQGNEPGRQPLTSQSTSNWDQPPTQQQQPPSWAPQANPTQPFAQTASGQIHAASNQSGIFAQTALPSGMMTSTPSSPSFANGGLTPAFPTSQTPQQSAFSQPASGLPVADAGRPPWMK